PPSGYERRVQDIGGTLRLDDVGGAGDGGSLPGLNPAGTLGRGHVLRLEGVGQGVDGERRRGAETTADHAVAQLLVAGEPLDRVRQRHRVTSGEQDAVFAVYDGVH